MDLVNVFPRYTTTCLGVICGKLSRGFTVSACWTLNYASLYYALQFNLALLFLSQGINYLHECKPRIVHRDLKSLNLLLAERVDDEYDTPIVKVS